MFLRIELGHREKYQPAKKLPDGQQYQGHEVGLHDQGEGYQQPKAFKSESSQVPQGVKEVGLT